MDMRRVYQVSGLFMLSFAAALIYGSLQMRYYSALGPGPGFFPFWLSAALAVLAVLMIIQATLEAPAALPEGFFASRGGYLRLLSILAGLAGAAVALDVLGFSLTTFLMNLFILVMLGQRHPPTTLVVAAVGSFGIFYLFTRWLNVPLPTGLFGF